VLKAAMNQEGFFMKSNKISLKTLILLWSVICVPTITSAQVNLPLPIPTTTKLGWDHDGINVTGFRVIIDNIPTELGLPPRNNTITISNPSNYTVPLPALTAGSHILIVQAYNATGPAMRHPMNLDILEIIVTLSIPNAATKIIIIQSN
jgi:hypothetical protein